MVEKARITTTGDLLLTGEIDERLPVITDGLVAHFPFDGAVTSVTGIPVWSDYKGGAERVYTGTGYGYYSKGFYLSDLMKDNNIVIGNTPDTEWWIYATAEIRVDQARKDAGGSSRIYLYSSTPSNSWFQSNNIGTTSTEWVKKTVKMRLDNFTDSAGETTDRITFSAYHMPSTIDIGESAFRNLTVFIDKVDSVYANLLSLEPSSNTNTTLTNNYIAIEEGTTNLVNTVTTAFSPWGGLTGSSTYYGTSEQRKGVQLTTLTSGGVGWYNSGGQKTITSNTIYTVSAKIRYEGGIPSANLLYVRQYDASGTQTSESGKYSSSYQYDLGNGWYKAFRTFTTDATAVKASVQGYEYSAGRKIWIEDVQLEQKAFATEFVDGSRASSKGLILDNSVLDLNEGTIRVEFTPSEGFFKAGTSWNRVFGHSTSVNANEIQVKRNSTGSNLVMSISNSSASPMTTWSNCPSQTIVAGETYSIIARWSLSSGRMSLTVQGVTNESTLDLTHMPTVKGTLMLGDHPSSPTRLSNSTFKNLSIYNRFLTDDELETSNNSQLNLKQNGDWNCDTIEEKPNGIPSDATYFPLSYNANDEYNIYTPSEETNVLYEDGSAWVGTTTVKPLSLGSTSLEYNLNESLSLDWGADWSIVYWKYPVATHTNNLTGYCIESIGCNSNSVGGGYKWWGKPAGADYIADAINGSTFLPDDYFNNWQRVSIVKSGTTVTFKFLGIGEREYTYSYTLGAVASNYMVTQYGYDLKLGGWDNSNPINAYFRDLIVATRALTDEELAGLQSPLNTHDGKLQILNQVHETEVL